MPDDSQWDPQSALIHREVTREKFAILLRHPQYPCSTKVKVKAAGDLESGIKRVAAKYLQKVAKDGKWNIKLFPSPHNPPQANDFEFAENVPLVWMPLSRSPNHLEDSILILRKDPEGKLIDRSVTLFAAYTASKTASKKIDSVIGSALGARIQLTIRGPETGENHVRITGAMFSAGLPTILNSQSPLVRILGARIKEGNKIGILTLSNTIGKLIANAVGLKPDAVIVNGFQPASAEPNEDLVNVFAHVPRESNARPELGDGLPARNISATVRLRPKIGKNKGVDEVLSFAIAPIVAHAVGNRTAKLFSPATAYRTDLLDPASQAGYGKREGVRPNRARAAFEPYRHDVELPDLSAPGSLDLTGKDGWFHVAQSRFAGSSANESLPHQCDPDHVPHARCNDFAAVSAYRQTSEFFQKMDGFGLARADFFRFTPEPKAKNPPLIVRYRAGLAFGAGRDGRTVNAQVEFDPPATPRGAKLAPGAKRPLQMLYCLADVTRTVSRGDPMGIATDPRWSWHEFGHVLLGGATGALELTFAHSVGDALAAITCDPGSEFAAEPRKPDLRGATFPWVYINRRHDRSVFEGWSWSGTLHRASRFSTASVQDKRKGYDSEQILSTTLFRLYRALGGDTVDDYDKPDLVARKDASDYTVYLIFRAIAALGSIYSVPIRTVDQFASMLIFADEVTQAGPSELIKNRVGGCALKVVRWAFEAQGLYSPDIDAVHDAPGLPPEIDLFIDDLRPDCEGPSETKRGGYMPVSLDWKTPKWHASPAAMKVDPAKKTLRVTVSNRGSKKASEAVVRVFYSEWQQGTREPVWGDGSWTPTSPSNKEDIPANGSKEFGPFALPKTKGKWLILAEAGCAADLAITYTDNNSVDDLPCAKDPTRLSYLVAGDNNLGLIVYQAT